VVKCNKPTDWSGHLMGDAWRGPRTASSRITGTRAWQKLAKRVLTTRIMCVRSKPQASAWEMRPWSTRSSPQPADLTSRGNEATSAQPASRATTTRHAQQTSQHAADQAEGSPGPIRPTPWQGVGQVPPDGHERKPERIGPACL
jgi:hypothetical protein